MSDFSFFIIILWRHDGILIEQVTFKMYVFRMFLRVNKPDCALWLAAPASTATILYNLLSIVFCYELSSVHHYKARNFGY